MSEEIDRRRAYQYGALHAAKHTQFVEKGVCKPFLFGVLFHPAQCLSGDGVRNVHARETHGQKLNECRLPRAIGSDYSYATVTFC